MLTGKLIEKVVIAVVIVVVMLTVFWFNRAMSAGIYSEAPVVEPTPVSEATVTPTPVYLPATTDEEPVAEPMPSHALLFLPNLLTGR